MNFYIGETVICSSTIKNNDSGEEKDPATSTKMAINKVQPYESIIESTAMTKDSTGTYHYDFASAGKSPGDYEAVCTADDGRITIEKKPFKLE